MKQPEDNKTIDIFDEVHEPLAPEVRTAMNKLILERRMGDTPKPVERCVFWIECADNGEVIEWRPLTKTQAVRMHKCTERNLPPNVSRHGWAVID